MAQDSIQVLNGEGEIYAADRLLRRTTYQLTILEGDEVDAPRIEGTIGIATEGEAIVLTRAQQLTLLMDDGRYLLFSLASATGRIRAHGGLKGIRMSTR